MDENVYHLVVGYIAAGLEPEKYSTFIFPHSLVPELNQLIIPFLTLVTNAELNRNPTVKEEIQVSSQQQINAGMYVYPVHQAADILFCKATVVPVGKGIQTAKVTTNDNPFFVPAQRMYKSSGFHEISREPWERDRTQSLIHYQKRVG
ncbi:hypothetical protein DSCO28_67590 [Desulfosarcina ovata subsp. sediminis]|uniref:Uncharacterized protein n=1 Tax=Desulfosarcina ovata subsp. sediminis TaxID=885957 RepID=A0A5K8A0Y1_9BACT|nr:hypothetical protein [Desulfosarcina ovata]BBO86193.1 hypothetical protein DSCO28_67590 [Desulfosarcina ovata subsp. sediminis]